MVEISKLKTNDNIVYEFKDSYARGMVNSVRFLPNNPYLHNSLPRCKNIQEYFDDDSLYERISNGTFEDLFIGDYWKAKYNGVEKTFRIAGFDTLYNNGSHSLNKHHAVIVPDEILGSSHMNQTNTTEGGYLNSYMNKTIIGGVVSTGGTSTINQILHTIFGSHLLVTEELLSSGVDKNAPSVAGANFSGSSNMFQWASCQAVLMTEIEIYGSNIFSSSAGDTGEGCIQLPLFQLIPQMKSIKRTPFWLSNVTNSTAFCFYDSTGHAGHHDATHQDGIRPRFVIG